MSLYDIALDEYETVVDGHCDHVNVWDWIHSQIDTEKFRRRAAYASRNPTIPVKVVLMEYNSGSRVENTLTEYYVPGTWIKTTCLQYNPRLLHYLHYKIANYDSNVEVYTRRKIVNGAPSSVIRQLTVKFNVQTSVTPPLPPSPIEKLDEEYDDA
jgi:hypothetical protein